jgi:hypothetical protein
MQCIMSTEYSVKDTDVDTDTGFDVGDLDSETGDAGEAEIYVKPEDSEDIINKSLLIEHKPVMPLERNATAMYTGETGRAVLDKTKDMGSPIRSSRAEAIGRVRARLVKKNEAIQAEQVTPVPVVDVEATQAAQPVNVAAVEPVKAVEVVEPAVSEDGVVKSPHDAVYDSSPTKAVDIAKMASRYGIKPDDPMCEAFVLVIEA